MKIHPLYASLEASAPSSIGQFIHTAFNEVKKLLQQGIDTAEERSNIINAAMAYYDKHINELVPEAMRGSIREGVVKGLTALLETAAKV